MPGRVLFISEGESNSSTRYRATAFFEKLRQAGWQPAHATAERGLAKRWRLCRQAAAVDVVVVLRKTFTPPLRILLRRAARRLVFDFDDAVFLRPDGSDAGSRGKRFEAMATMCDQIWAGNDYLAEHARRFNPQVTVLPTVVDPSRYAGGASNGGTGVSPIQSDDDRRDARPTKDAGPTTETLDLVWIGSQSNRPYLESVLPVFESLIDDVPTLRLKIIADFTLASHRLPIVAEPWSAATEAAALRAAHIGVAPLPDDAWTRGKCGLKSLQYMAAALPVVATDVGAHRDIIVDGETGLLVSSDNDWRRAIVRLVRSPEARAAMGHAGRARVESAFSIDAVAPRMIDQLNRA